MYLYVHRRARQERHLTAANDYLDYAGRLITARPFHSSHVHIDAALFLALQEINSAGRVGYSNKDISETSRRLRDCLSAYEEARPDPITLKDLLAEGITPFTDCSCEAEEDIEMAAHWVDEADFGAARKHLTTASGNIVRARELASTEITHVRETQGAVAARVEERRIFTCIQDLTSEFLRLSAAIDAGLAGHESLSQGTD